jgi:hypothetical protein
MKGLRIFHSWFIKDWANWGSVLVALLLITLQRVLIDPPYYASIVTFVISLVVIRFFIAFQRVANKVNW